MADNEEPVKQKKARKPISPERKKQLVEQLKKARERAAEVRKERKTRNAEVKKKQVDEGVKKELAKRETEKKEPPVLKPDPRDSELERLRNQVKNFTLQDIARKSKPKPKPKKREDTTPPSPVKNEIMEPESISTIHEGRASFQSPPPPDPEYEPPKQKAAPKPPPPAPSQPPTEPKVETPHPTASIPLPPQKIQRPFQAFRRKKQRHY